MEPNGYKNEIKANSPLKNFYRHPVIEKYEQELRYNNQYRGTAETEASVLKPV